MPKGENEPIHLMSGCRKGICSLKELVWVLRHKKLEE